MGKVTVEVNYLEIAMQQNVHYFN